MQSKRRYDRIIRWSVIGLIVAIIADLAQNLIDPASSGKAADIFAGASQHHGRMVASAALLLATSLFIIPAAFGLVRTLDERGRRIGRVAAVLALMGGLGHAALAALNLAWAAMPSKSTNSDQMIALLERVNDAASFGLVLPLVIAFPLSLVALYIALVRGAVAPRWILAPALAAPVVAIGGGNGTTATGIALVCFLIAGCGLAAHLFGAQATRDSSPVPATAPVVS